MLTIRKSYGERPTDLCAPLTFIFHAQVAQSEQLSFMAEGYIEINPQSPYKRNDD